MTNPLLETHDFPPFDRIEPGHVEPAMDQLLAEGRRQLRALLQAPPAGWALIAELEAIEDRIGQAWSPVSHLNSVVNSDALRKAYNAVLPKLTAYYTELGQNAELFKAYQALADSEGFTRLDQSQQQLIRHALRDFKLSGIDLPAADKQRYGEIKTRLSELTSRFSENVLDATHGWTKHFSDAAPLAGLPQSALDATAQAARQKAMDGYLVTLEFPAYQAVMTYADNRELRHEVYAAFCTRASDQGPQAGQWDNSALIDEILALRHELARLLGFDHYSDYSLATKMAESSDRVVGFLRDLAARSLPQARAEYRELQAFAREQDGLEVLEAWDLGYYAEKLRQQRYALSQEELRPYFPLPKVLEGLFAVVNRLYGVTIAAEPATGLWHPDARRYRLDRDGDTLGYFYLDLYARPNKRGGAWMDECRVRRRRLDGSLQRPVAYLVCNFGAPVGERPSLLTHNEVTTLFHEFGHGLHHLLTRVDWAGVSGINGVAWDAVELPSQFLENWCWEPEALALIAGHHQTGEPLPAELLARMLAARNFQAGMIMVRQLEFALFDFLLHREYRPEPATDVQALLDRVRGEVAVVQPPAFNRFQHSFTHIFAGGYAAGYYSYKWAEVLSADAFSRFEEEGIFNPDTGRAFEQTVLSQGGSRDAMALFVAFRGREPRVDALLRHSGIGEEGNR